MATWTTPITWTNGSVTAATANAQWSGNLNWLKGAFTQLNVTSDSAKAQITPALTGCHITKSADQSITNATFTAITGDFERFDSNAFHDTVTNNTRITIPASMAGYYLCGGSILWASNATGRRDVWIYVNSIATGFSITGNTSIPGSAVSWYMTAGTVLFQFAVGDFIELVVNQTSGGSLNVTALSAVSPNLWIHRISST